MDHLLSPSPNCSEVRRIDGYWLVRFTNGLKFVDINKDWFSVFCFLSSKRIWTRTSLRAPNNLPQADLHSLVVPVINVYGALEFVTLIHSSLPCLCLSMWSKVFFECNRINSHLEHHDFLFNKFDAATATYKYWEKLFYRTGLCQSLHERFINNSQWWN